MLKSILKDCRGTGADVQVMPKTAALVTPAVAP